MVECPIGWKPGARRFNVKYTGAPDRYRITEDFVCGPPWVQQFFGFYAYPVTTYAVQYRMQEERRGLAQVVWRVSPRESPPY